MMKVKLFSLCLFLIFELSYFNSLGQSTTRTKGLKKYEISNHLGNVLATISDRKLAVDDGSVNPPGETDFYKTDILTQQDYYPFGMIMPERNDGDYRFGFQGQEQDDKVKGKGNNINYKYRMHDARLGRFFAVDPLTNKYPFYSSYAFSGNRLIDAVEFEGLEPIVKNNILIGIRWLKDAGPTQMANYLNNPVIQKEYGYDLETPINWYSDIVEPNTRLFNRLTEVTDFTDINELAWKEMNVNTGIFIPIRKYSKAESSRRLQESRKARAERQYVDFKSELWNIEPSYSTLDIDLGEKLKSSAISLVGIIANKVLKESISMDEPSSTDNSLMFEVKARLRTMGRGSFTIIPVIENKYDPYYGDYRDVITKYRRIEFKGVDKWDISDSNPNIH